MAISAQAINLPAFQTSKSKKVSRELMEIAEADYRSVGLQIAAQEVDQQIKQGNKPTHILVDGHEQRQLAEWRKSIRVDFIDVGTLMEALRAGWIELQRLARRVTGTTAQRFEVWVGATRVGNDPSAVTASMVQKPGIDVMIVGPMVSYTRKYRFLFGSRKAATRRTRVSRSRRRKGERVAMSIHEAVVRKLKRNTAYKRYLTITDEWLEVPNQNPRGKTSVFRVPTVTIRMPERKGQV